MNYTPPNQSKNPPTLPEVLDTQKHDIFKNLNCVKIGVIQSFDAGNQTATVKVAFQQVNTIQPDGTREVSDYPLHLVVPVVFPAGGGFTLTFPVNAGDECVLLYNDRQLDDWFYSGAGSVPSIGRLHDLSDAIAIVGLRNATRSLAGVSASATQLRSDDGETYVEVGPGKIQLVADEVVIHGRNKTTFDAGGTGFVYTPAQIDTYTNGVPVVTHAPHPPEVPT